MNTKYEEGKKKHKKRKKMQIDPKTSMRSESADQVPREQGCCLLIRSGSYVQLVDQQKDDTKIPDKTINGETKR